MKIELLMKSIILRMVRRSSCRGALPSFCIFLLLMIRSYSECPNACSAHGRCGAFDVCICYANYMAADCSESKKPLPLFSLFLLSLYSDDSYYFLLFSTSFLCILLFSSVFSRFDVHSWPQSCVSDRTL